MSKKTPNSSKTGSKKATKKDDIKRKPGQPLSNEKQEQFCREYIVDLNASQAYIRAGYSKNAANKAASRLLANVDIQNRISELKEESVYRVSNKEELEITADRVLLEMARLAYSNVGNLLNITPEGDAFIDMTQATESDLRALSGFKVTEMGPVRFEEGGLEFEREAKKIEIKMYDKGRALENLMKHLGLLKDTVEVDGLNDLVETLQKGKARVAKLREQREKAKGVKPE